MTRVSNQTSVPVRRSPTVAQFAPEANANALCTRTVGFDPGRKEWEEVVDVGGKKI